MPGEQRLVDLNGNDDVIAAVADDQRRYFRFVACEGWHHSPSFASARASRRSRANAAPSHPGCANSCSAISAAEPQARQLGGDLGSKAQVARQIPQGDLADLIGAIG